MSKKIVLFGGSFDPVHSGHLEVAKASLQKLCAEKVIFIPANRSPHKSYNTFASAKDRYEMIRIAVKNEASFLVDDCEIVRPQPSYTLDTIKHFKKQYSEDTELLFLIGADTIADLDKWYKIDELLKLCRLCTMYRGGFEKPDFSVLKNVFTDDDIDRLQNDIIETPMLNISSTDIRKTISEGKTINDIVPNEVVEYIRKNGLYSSR